MIDMHIYNAVLKQGKFAVDSSNRSFKYGDGLFETIKVAQGSPLFYRGHYSRLVRGLSALNYDVPLHFTLKYVHDALLKLIGEAKVYNGVIRLQAYRDGGGTYTPESSHFSWIAEIKQSADNQPFYRWRDAEYQLGVYDDFLIQKSPIGFFKSSNALPYVLAGQYAKRQELDNVVLLNTNQNIVETIAENIFLYSNGVVSTPANSEGCIDGVLKSVIKKLCKWNKIDYVEGKFTIKDLQQAEEVFLTNTIKGIQSVTSFQDKQYITNFTKGLQLKLNERVSQILEKL